MSRLHTSPAGILRLYQPFLWLYPAEFRDEYRRELCLAFVDRWREERSITGLLFVWLQAILGIFYQAPREHYHMIVHDIRYALRILRKDLSVTAAAILIFALGIGSTTLEFKISFVRPITPETGMIRAEGVVINQGRRIGIAEGRVTDQRDRLLVHGTTTCLIFEA